MANQALESFAALMESNDMRVRLTDEDENVGFVGFDLGETNLGILVIFSEDCTDVSFVGRDFLKVPEDRSDVIYKVMNECNSQYRWVKFVWDEESGEATVRADARIEPETCAEECFGTLQSMVSIVKEVYPVFMKAIWA